MSNWRPASELPDREHGWTEQLLVVVDYRNGGVGRFVTTTRLGPDGWVGYLDSAVTHWMPLPLPPDDGCAMEESWLK